MLHRAEVFLDFSTSPIYKSMLGTVFYVKNKRQLLNKMDRFYRKEWLVRFVNRPATYYAGGLHELWYWDKFLKREVKVCVVIEKPWIPDLKL